MSSRLDRIMMAVFLFASPCWAGSAVSIRLVEATNSDSPRQQGVEDVAGTLRESVPFNSFTTIATASVALPVENATAQLAAFTVTCSGKQDSMSIVVRMDGQEKLKTTVNLRDGKPLILGGFPAKSGRSLLVFLVR